MKIPFLDLTRQYEEISIEIKNEVFQVMNSGQYIEGYATKQFEEELAEYLGVKHVITCGSGTDALRIALQSCGIHRGDEVITTAFSFFATAEAVAQAGAVPVFADIDEKTLNIDVNSLKSRITQKTKAIIPVHIFGLPADMHEINLIAEQAGIPVIEDACQAIGAEYQGKRAGALGTVGCFSFYPTKNLGCMGDGGAISTNDDDIAKACRAYKNHASGRMGAETRVYLYGEEIPELKEMDISGNGLYDPCKYYNYFIGGNSRLDSIQAAILLYKLKKIEEYNGKRGKIARRYTEGLRNLPMKLPEVDYADRQPCWHQYAVLCDEKEKMISYLNERGIGTGAFYPIPLHLQKAFTELNYKEGSLPVAESVCRRSICLPIFPELSDGEIDHIINSIKEYYN